jgi:hypothetical protein
VVAGEFTTKNSRTSLEGLRGTEICAGPVGTESEKQCLVTVSVTVRGAQTAFAKKH